MPIWGYKMREIFIIAILIATLNGCSFGYKCVKINKSKERIIRWQWGKPKINVIIPRKKSFGPMYREDTIREISIVSGVI